MNLKKSSLNFTLKLADQLKLLIIAIRYTLYWKSLFSVLISGILICQSLSFVQAANF